MQPPPTAPRTITIEELTAERDAALEEVRKLRAELDGMQEIMLNVYRNTKGTLNSIPLTPEQIDSTIAMLMAKASVKR